MKCWLSWVDGEQKWWCSKWSSCPMFKMFLAILSIECEIIMILSFLGVKWQILSEKFYCIILHSFWGCEVARLLLKCTWWGCKGYFFTSTSIKSWSFGVSIKSGTLQVPFSGSGRSTVGSNPHHHRAGCRVALPAWCRKNVDCRGRWGPILDLEELWSLRNPSFL